MSTGRSTVTSQLHCKTHKTSSPFFRCIVPCGSWLILLTVFTVPVYHRSRYKSHHQHHASTNSIVRDRETVAKEGNLRLQLNSSIRRSTRERPPFTRALCVSKPKLMSRAKPFANSGTQKPLDDNLRMLYKSTTAETDPLRHVKPISGAHT